MNDYEIEQLLELYLKKYEDKYTPKAIEFLRKNFMAIREKNEHIDIVSQIQVALNIMDPKGDIYNKYFNFLKSRYNLGQNILEVACGNFPALSKYIDDYQKNLKSGTITAYDPKLIMTEYGNIKLYDKLFDEKTNIKDYSLITAMYPCEATTKIIKAANTNDIDFSILTCGCTHFSNEQLLFSTHTIERWQEYIYDVALESLPEDRTITIEFLNDKRIGTPIISSHKKTKKMAKTIKPNFNKKINKNTEKNCLNCKI